VHATRSVSSCGCAASARWWTSACRATRRIPRGPRRGPPARTARSRSRVAIRASVGRVSRGPARACQGHRRHLCRRQRHDRVRARRLRLAAGSARASAELSLSARELHIADQLVSTEPHAAISRLRIDGAQAGTLRWQAPAAKTRDGVWHPEFATPRWPGGSSKELDSSVRLPGRFPGRPVRAAEGEFGSVVLVSCPARSSSAKISQNYKNRRACIVDVAARAAARGRDTGRDAGLAHLRGHRAFHRGSGAQEPAGQARERPVCQEGPREGRREGRWPRWMRCARGSTCRFRSVLAAGCVLAAGPDAVGFRQGRFGWACAGAGHANHAELNAVRATWRSGSRRRQRRGSVVRHGRAIALQGVRLVEPTLGSRVVIDSAIGQAYALQRDGPDRDERPLPRR